MGTKVISPWYYKINGNLIKERKPCLPGDYVHIKKWEGCYRVYYVDVFTFTILKNRKFHRLSWSEFRCLKGNGTSELSQIKKQLKIITNYTNMLSIHLKETLNIIKIM